jgi:hypothetical protein
MKKVCSDLVFNGKLDETMFSLIPPKGYEVETQKASNGPHRPSVRKPCGTPRA